jgi:hypothetical protein
MTDGENIGTRTLWAILFLVQILVIGFGLLLVGLDALSTPKFQTTFAVDRNHCTEEQRKHLSDQKSPPSLISHCASLEKYVATLEGVQAQLSTWLERGLLIFLILNLSYVLIEALILFKGKRRPAN